MRANGAYAGMKGAAATTGRGMIGAAKTGAAAITGAAATIGAKIKALITKFYSISFTCSKNRSWNDSSSEKWCGLKESRWIHPRGNILSTKRYNKASKETEILS